MTKPAAFRATYSDLKLIKTRQCVQVIFELPLADFKMAYEILGGLPDLPNETWFAIAPLKLPPAEKEISSMTSATPRLAQPPVAAKRMDWRELQPAAQAGIRCSDPIFRKFLEEQHHFDVEDIDEEFHAEMAAEFVRSFCKVASRSELGTNHKARVLWHSLDELFLAWKHVDA